MNRLKELIAQVREKLPENFSLILDGNSGLYYETPKDGLQRICNPIAVTAIKRKFDGSGYGKEITFWNLDGKECTCYISQKTLLGKDALEELADKGLDLPHTSGLKGLLLSYLIRSNPEARVIEAEKTGWTDSNFNTYVCPSFTVGKEESNSQDRIVLPQGLKNCGFAMRGTLEDWQENVCKPCENNENLTFMLSVGLGSMILGPLNLNGALYNLVGRSSTGKTTAAYVAASIFGSHNFLKSWHLTSNGLEGIAEHHNDSTLILDELSQVSSKDTGSNPYMLVNGSGKGRSQKDGNPRAVKTWRLNAISTGEICIADKINEGGGRVKGGHTVRAIDIYAEIPNGYGIYNDLHEFSSGSEFSNALKERTSLFYGVPAFEFAEGVAKKGGIETLQGIRSKIRKKLYDHFFLEKADGQVQRVADLFAGNTAAGIFASSDNLGILTHRCEAIEEDNFNVFSRWIENRGSIKSQEEEQIINHIREYLEQSGNRLAHINSQYGVVAEAKSYNSSLGVVYNNIYERKSTYYLYAKAYKEEIIAGFDQKIAKQILKNRGILELDSDGSNKRCPYEICKNRRMVTLTFTEL